MSSQVNSSVLRYDGTTGAFLDEFVASGSGGLFNPQQLQFGPDGNLYVASGNSNQLLRYDGATGAFIDVFAGTNLNLPADFIVGSDELYYVTNFLTNEVTRYDASGAFVDVFINQFGNGLDGPIGILSVPEPSSFALAALAAGVMQIVRRRKRAAPPLEDSSEVGAS